MGRTPASRRASFRASFALGVGTLAASAQGVVVEGMQSMVPDAPAYAGYWNGSTGIPISPNWFITAQHTGGEVGFGYYLHGVWYIAQEIRRHPTRDLQLIRVDGVFPGYHHLQTNPVAVGDPCVMGGFGRTAAAALPNNAGYDWAGNQAETFGANRIEGTGVLMSIRFDAPSAPSAVAFESSFAVNDSGGGVFVEGQDGSLLLAGLAVSVTGYGQSAYGAVSYCLTLSEYTTWIMPIVDPSVPITSAVVAPRAAIGGGGPLIPALVLTSLGSIRFGGLSRRRRDTRNEAVLARLADAC